jgi:hypothetical protein
MASAGAGDGKKGGRGRPPGDGGQGGTVGASGGNPGTGVADGMPGARLTVQGINGSSGEPC